MPSTKVCCGCNIFALTKGFTLFEIGMSFVCLFQTISKLMGKHYPTTEFSLTHFTPEVTVSQCVTVVAWIAYLFLELHGLKKFKHTIIVVGCIVRCLKTFMVLLIMIVIPFYVEKIEDPDVAELVR